MPTRRRTVDLFHRHVANPLARPLWGLLAGTALLETTGRRTGLPRTTPIGGRLLDGSFWLVSDHGPDSDHMRNIAADPRVRIRVARQWWDGVAHPMPDDDPRARLRRLPAVNGLLVRALGTGLMTVRIDLR